VHVGPNYFQGAARGGIAKPATKGECERGQKLKGDLIKGGGRPGKGR